MKNRIRINGTLYEAVLKEDTDTNNLTGYDDAVNLANRFINKFKQYKWDLFKGQGYIEIKSGRRLKIGGQNIYVQIILQRLWARNDYIGATISTDNDTIAKVLDGLPELGLERYGDSQKNVFSTKNPLKRVRDNTLNNIGKALTKAADELDDNANLTDAEKEDLIDKWFEELVPDTGNAKTVAGEIVRAVNKIGYRIYNDGDSVRFEDPNPYYPESQNCAARYLRDVVRDSSVQKALNALCKRTTTNNFHKLLVEIADYLLDNPDLFDKHNSNDYFSYKDPRSRSRSRYSW